MTDPELSIIIPAYNSELTIKSCINSLTSQTIPREKFEVIVVDDCSKDKTVDYAKEAGADLIICNETNKGAGYSRNVGAKQARGKFLAFIDSDCRAQNGWIKTIFQELKDLPAITGPIKNGNPHSTKAWAEYFLEMGPFHEYRKKAPIRTIPGGNGAYQKKIFFEAGGFAKEKLSEDFWLSESLKRLKFLPIFVPDLSIYHMNRTEMKKICDNMKLQGKFFVRNRRMIPTAHYKFLIKSRFFTPLIFIIKFMNSFKNATQSKKTGKFLQSLPYLVRALISFCEGNLEEMKKKSN